MNINEPITNDKLVDIMKRLKQNNATKEDFFEELFKAKFLCPIKMELKDELQKGNKIDLDEGTVTSNYLNRNLHIGVL